MALTRGGRLFIKNTAHRKMETFSTVGDACSLAVSEVGFQLYEGPLKSGTNSESLKVA